MGDGDGDPIETFLRFVLASMEAGHAVLWRLDHRSQLWTLQREARAPSWPALETPRLEAAGHPLTWSHREGLLLQVPSRRILPGLPEDDWTLLGPVPDRRYSLTLGFRGPPPKRARTALEAALRHLVGLAPPAGPGGEPFDRAEGMQ